jgi:hypothetical protein
MTLDSSSNLAVTGNVSATAFSGNGSGLTGVTAGSLANSVTFNNGGGGAASGTAFNGAAGVTVSWNTIGAVTTNNTNQTIAGTKTFSTGVSITGSGGLNMNNNNITGVNHIIINDPGANEGIAWAGGSGWAIYESPDNLSNAAGNLQFVTGSTRRMTLNTSGQLEALGGFSGNGASLTALNASNLSSGTVAGARLGGNQTMAGDKSFTGIVTISGAGQNRLNLRNTTNAGGIGINFSDNTGAVQNGTLKYVHADGQSFGGGEAFIFEGTEPVTNVVVNGGNLIATGEVTAFFSDERLKDFKGNIDNALEKILGLNGYYYTENDIAKSLGYNNDKLQVGVSAQEVQKVLPEVVEKAPISYREDVTEDYLTVKYEKMVPLLIEAIKEQQSQIDELRAMIKKLMDK